MGKRKDSLAEEQAAADAAIVAILGVLRRKNVDRHVLDTMSPADLSRVARAEERWRRR